MLNTFPGMKLNFKVTCDYTGIAQPISFEMIVDVPSVVNDEAASAGNWDHNGSTFTKARWGFAWTYNAALSTSPTPIVTESGPVTIPSSLAGLGSLNAGLHAWLGTDQVLSLVAIKPGEITVHKSGISNLVLGAA